MGSKLLQRRLFLFCPNLLKSVIKEVLTTSINHSRNLTTDGIPLHKGMREEASAVPAMASTRQGRLLVPLYASLVWHGLGSNLRLPALKADTLLCDRQMTEMLWYAGDTKIITKLLKLKCAENKS